ncbi:tigger transposable element-derived protein 1-like [Diorhabda carinulata]|uniref:tigger transposable element-derived protein 1-like n=1 Tax=Diorhabda carinulata TaxID=1163345 RepID=UPI00259FEAFA|nr:tigger transposable element-derived protein 1-like [Diorhabda carinulata]
MLQTTQQIYYSDLTTCIPVEVVFLSPNTTALIQPINQGVILNFKAYYLRRTFKQMFEKTDGEENKSVREFWKNYNIVDAVENIGLSWNGVKERSLKGVWKNIWPDLSKSDDVGHSVDADEIVEEIVKLTKQTGFEGVNVEDVEEIIQEAAASLSNDELKELTEQKEKKNVDSSDSEEQKEFSMAFVKRSLSTITEIMDKLIENDPNFDRSSKVRRGVRYALSVYEELLRERRKRKRQTLLDAFVTKRQNTENAEG